VSGPLSSQVLQLVPVEVTVRYPSFQRLLWGAFPKSRFDSFIYHRPVRQREAALQEFFPHLGEGKTGSVEGDNELLESLGNGFEDIPCDLIQVFLLLRRIHKLLGTVDEVLQPVCFDTSLGHAFREECPSDLTTSVLGYQDDPAPTRELYKAGYIKGKAG